MRDVFRDDTIVTSKSQEKFSQIFSVSKNQSDLRDKKIVSDLQSALHNKDQKSINYNFTLIYNKYYKKLHMLLSQTNHSYDDREDIIAETFAKVLKKIPKYEIRDVDFAARLTRIASNANIDFFRKKDRRVSSFEFDDVQKYANIKSNNHTIIDILEYEESKRKLQIGVNALHENLKNIFDLRFEQGLSYKKIAEKLQMPIGTVEANIFYIRKKLHKTLK